MLKLLIVPVVVMLTTITPSSVLAQNNLHRDYSSSDKAYSESKRLYKEGVKYALTGLYKQAAQLFQRAIKLDPQFSDAHFALGHAYFDMRDWQNAVDSFERVLEISPNDQEARDRLTYAREMLAQQAQKTADPKSVSEPTVEPVSLSIRPEEKTEKTEVDPATNDAVAPAAESLTSIYYVGPGDVLDIRINESPSPQSTLFTISPAGLLDHPLLAEPLYVSGLSVDQISAAFDADLKRRALLDDPKVLIGVRDYVSHAILVSGLVKDSGTKILRREAIPLYVVVADAQPLPEAAQVAVVRSATNEIFEIALTQTAEMNLLVRPGDVITLQPSVTKFLYISGEVKSPGEKTYRRGLTLTQAIMAAGGATEKAKEARVGRDDGHGFLTINRFKLKDIEAGKIPDPLVRPGDRISIVR